LATSGRPALRGIRADLKRRGAQIGAADLMIAAHARTVGATVVTNNVKDFGRVKGLKVENSTQKNKKP
jgi:tRNA(fMet)-specific endonuclease VapC